MCCCALRTQTRHAQKQFAPTDIRQMIVVCLHLSLNLLPQTPVSQQPVLPPQSNPFSLNLQSVGFCVDGEARQCVWIWIINKECAGQRQQQYIMITSAQKRRNYSRQLAYQSRPNLARTPKSDLALNSYQVMGLLKEKALNRSTIPHQPTDNQLKKKPQTPLKINHNLSTIDTQINGFSNKIKNLLKNEETPDNKENSNVQALTTNFFQKSRSAIFRRPDPRDTQQPSTSPYFIECLRRKSIIATEACMHIHNSMLIFKQYLRSAHFAKSRTPDPKIPPQIENRKTIVLDMDETLIHTNQLMTKGYELKVPFKSIQGKIISGYVSVRPYAKEIIKNMSKYCDVIIFTAGNQCYADPILDYLDPDHLIKHRLYRQSCTMINNQMFVKDLRVIGRKLENVVLVDNAPHSYMMQLSNGIPILNYMKGKDDDQLVKLEAYLMGLLEVEDVRVVNSQTFRLAEYARFDNYNKLIHDLYGKWL